MDLSQVGHFATLVLALLAGFWILGKGADILVDGAGEVALFFGLSKVFIGATILAFGTSLPELAASLSASIKAAGGQLKAADLAIGNVVGSNLANIALVLGFSLLYGSIKVGKEWNKLEFPSLIFFSVGFFILAFFYGNLGFISGVLLLTGFGLFIAMLLLREKHGQVEEEGQEEINIKKASLLTFAGLVLLFLGAELLVGASLGMAKLFSVEEGIIGLSVVALGTSLPELATSVQAVKKGEHKMALGNIVGSNIYNITLVLGVPAVFLGLRVDPNLIKFDMPIMLLVTFLLVGFSMVFKSLKKNHGFIFLGVYVSYMIFLGLRL